MFKMFDWINKKKLSHHSFAGFLKQNSEKELRRQKSRIKAKEFAEAFEAESWVLSQFFEIKPKLGKFGVCEKDDENTIIILPLSFIAGLTVKFYVSYEGITGFEFTEIDNDK
jgi:hypothetical protein|tara:strand:+ start:3538 stop:3873 length:336 start_codon:yes stop_codon:yes gene_type:complete